MGGEEAEGGAKEEERFSGIVSCVREIRRALFMSFTHYLTCIQNEDKDWEYKTQPLLL